MIETVKLAGTVLGGLGLFLLAIGMMTDGLKLAAGPALRSLLSQWSRTPLRGIFSGYVMTAVVQSSSAVTVASLGFVNAGLISMRQALGIVYGANVGTTMTGWLVAIIGFKLNIHLFALPLIGIGMLVRLVRPKHKIASFGLALVGFGLFFIGIDILREAFEGIVQAFDISKFAADGVQGVAIFLLIGFVMTVLTQSSSASIALTITAASSGMVGTYAAGAMVIGANIGTTSTALLAAIGATSNAKRVAAAQVIFNVATAIVALLILPLLFYLIDYITELLGVTADPAISLAIFHTVFNLLGVLLIYPQNDRLANFLERRFSSWEEHEAHPRFLDKTIAQTPDLAVNALLLELLSIADKVIALYDKFVAKRNPRLEELESEETVVKSFCGEVSQFIVSIESATLSDATSEALATLMRVDNYLLTSNLVTANLALALREREMLTDVGLNKRVDEYFGHTLGFLQVARSEECEDPTELLVQFDRLKVEHEGLKAELLAEATRSRISVTQMSQAIDCLAQALHIADQWHKAFARIQAIEADINASRDATTDDTPPVSSD